MKIHNPSSRRSIKRLIRPLLALALGWLALHPQVKSVAKESGSILFIVGPSNHAPGTHEVKAGARLMKHCLEQTRSVRDLKIEIHEQWPAEFEVLSHARAIVFTGDQFPPVRFDNTDEILGQLSALSDRGCGFVAVHYGIGINPPHAHSPKIEAALTKLFGGYAWFVRGHKDGTVPRIMQSTIVPEPTDHPAVRGVGKFSFRDEPYFRNKFPQIPEDSVFTALATSMLPPDDPMKEIVAWSIEHKKRSRGAAIVMPHFYINWKDDNLRMLILNSIVWAADLKVPKGGVASKLPPLETFEPEAVQFTPREK